MPYLLGSDSEQLGFDRGRTRYTPEGQRHAVDLEGGNGNTRGAVLGYALCGRAVRVWPGRHFDADTPDVHPACAALAQQAVTQRREARPTGLRQAR